MGLWGPTGDDAAGDDARRLPALRLDAQGGAPEDVPQFPTSRGDRPWMRWLGFGAALVVGVIVGVVGSDARHDAVERARVDLIGGNTTLVRPSSADPAHDAWLAEFLVFNPGRQTVEIVDISVDGWAIPGDASAQEPTTVEPDTWTAVPAQLAPDCDVEPAGASTETTLTADVTVRTASTETTVPLTFPPGESWLDATWSSECSPADAPNVDLAIAFTEMLDQQPGVHSVRARLHLAASTGEGQGTVIRIWSHVPGFDFVYRGLPAEINGDDTAPLELEWEVASCEIVERLNEAQLGFHIAADANSTSARVQSTPVPAAILVALGRLSARVCGL